MALETFNTRMSLIFFLKGKDRVGWGFCRDALERFITKLSYRHL